MQFWLEFQPEAEETLIHLQLTNPKRHKKVLKTLALMEANLRHPGLQTHKYESLGPQGEEMFEAYVGNNTPGTMRIFWYYGPRKNILTIHAITLHP